MSWYTEADEGFSLHDCIEAPEEISPWDSTACEYHGFHIVPQGDGNTTFHVQYDGHAGDVWKFDGTDYTDVLELVKDLNRNCLIELQHYDYTDDKAGLVEWAGKIMTSDAEKAEREPKLYIHIPDDVPDVDPEEWQASE
jgi:hypothetical protein